MAVQAPFYHPDILHAQQPVCSIIIPLYNRVELTRCCLEALANNTGSGISFELILIDNASVDATPDYLRTLTGNVTVLTNRLAFTVARSCNQGARLAVGDYLVFLRQAVCPQQQWLEALLSGVTRDGADLTGAKILFPDGRVRHAGIAFDEQLLPYQIFSGFAGDSPAVESKRLMQAVSGECLLVGRELFQSAGGFDEGYQNGFEDVDFCLRAGSRGSKVLYNPASVLVSAAETGETGAGGYQNMERFLSTWQGKITPDDLLLYQAEGFMKKTMPDGRIYILPSMAQKAATPAAPSATDDPQNPEDQKVHLSSAELYQKAQELIAAGREAEALLALEEAAASTPLFAPACNDLAVLLVRGGELERGLALHEQAVSLEPNTVVFRKNLADLYFAGFGRVDDAVEIYSDIITRYPEDVEALCTLSQISTALGRPAEAKIYIERAVQLAPENEVARRFLQTLNSATEAEPEEDAPPSPGERYETACRLAEAGDRDGAIRELESILVTDPAFSIAHNDLGVLYLQAGDAESSLRHHREAVSLSPDNADFGKNLAELYLVGLGEVDAAIATYVELLEMHPADVEVLTGLGQISLSLDRPDEARTFCSRALALEPGNEAARQVLALLDGHVADDCAGETVTPAAATIDSEESGKIALLERRLQITPHDPVSHNDLGVLYWQTGNHEKSLACYERAVELAPQNTLFRKNLADIYLVGFGRTDDAVAILVDLIQKNPQDAEALFSLGQICVGFDRMDDARILFGRVAELDPSHPLAPQLLKELDGGGDNDFFLTRAQR